MISAFRRRKRRRVTKYRYRVIGVVLFTLLVVSEATAQTADATMRTAARELATQGAEAYERGDFVLSYDRLTRAFSLYPVPSISIMQARALVHLGRFVEALDRYEETRRMPLAEDAPEAYRAAAREATIEAEQVRVRLSRLFIQVKTEGTDAKDVTVSLDGKVLPSALLEVDCPTDPGEHVVTLQSSNRAPVTRKVRVSESERLVVELKLVVASQSASPGVTSNTVTEPAVDSSRKWWGLGAIGGGAVALLGSVITGKSALDKKHYLDRVCDPGCPAGSQNDIDSFRTNRTVSYAAAGVSLALVGVGGYLLLSGERTGTNTAIGINPTGLSWVGRF